MGGNIEAIQSDAFAGEAFTMMKGVTIKENSNLIFVESNSFGRLLHLKYLQLCSMAFHSEFIWGENTALGTMVINNGPGLAPNISLEYLLHKISLPKIEAFWIYGSDYGAEFTILAPSNLTTLRTSKLYSLGLDSCGIELILNGTFDAIGRQLKKLWLEGNRIKHIYLEQFGSFLNGNQFTKTIILERNPFECDCNFYLVKSVLRANLIKQNKEFEIDEYNRISCVTYKSRINLTQECPNMQIMNASKMYADFGSLLVYSKFNLKLDLEENSLKIRTEIMPPFKILMIRYDPIIWNRTSKFKSKCMDINQLKGNTKCLLHRSGVSHFQDNFYFLHPQFTFVSVFHLTYLRAWPLHLMTIRTEQQISAHSEGHQSEIWTASVISLTGLLIGFAGVISLKYLKR